MDGTDHFARRAMRWLTPSAVAACAGGVVAGVADTFKGDGELGLDSVAATGFVVIAAIPILLALGVVARATIAAWRPSELAARLTEDDGGMPRLAGWMGTLVLGVALFAWMVFRGTWLLVSWTQFKPNVVALAQPIIAVASALAIVLVAPLAVSLIAAIARRLDARWRKRGHRTLLSPRVLFVTSAVVAAIALVVVWLIVISPRIGPLAIGVLVAPALGLAVAIAAHQVRSRAVSFASIVLAGTCVVFALVTAFARPAAALGIWGDQPIAGVVVERVFSIERIRSSLDLDDYRPIARPGARHPDVIVVMIDTVRADHTPPYGGKADMPILTALGQRGAVFHWAFSPSNVTRRSVPTMLTGTSPDRVRGRVVGWGLRLDPRHILVAERLRAAGYDTAGFVCCGGLYGEDLRTGFDRGLATLVIDESADNLGAKAARFVTARAERGDKRPLFMWMHFLEPHNWSVNTAIASGGMGEQYDRSLAMVDKALVPLIAAFADRPPAEAPIIIVTSDHGEGLGEHGQRNHSTDLYNSQIRVPLVIAGPGVSAVHPTETVGLVDLVPTIIDLAGFEPPHGRSIDGRSIADLARGQPSSTPGTAFAAMIADRSNPGGVTAIVDGPWKMIERGGARELYNMHHDPDEHANVAAQHPEIVGRLAVMLGIQRARARMSAFD